MKNLFIRLTNIANMEYNYQETDPMNRALTKGNGWKMTRSPQSSPVWSDKSSTMSTRRASRGRSARKRGSVSFRGGPRHPTRRGEFKRPQQPLDRWDMGRTNETCSRTPFYDYRYDTQRDFGTGAEYHDYEDHFKSVHQAPRYADDYGQHSQNNPNWTEYDNHQVYFGVQPGNDCVPNGFYMVENQQVFQPNNEFPETANMICDSTRTFHENNRNNRNRIENVHHKVYFGTQPANNYIPKSLCMAENQQVFQPNNEFPETAKVGYNSSRAPHGKNPDAFSSTSDRTVCNNNLNSYSQNTFHPPIEQNDLLIMKTLFEPPMEEIQYSVPEHHHFCPNEITSNITDSKNLKEIDEMALNNLDFSDLTLPREKQISNALTLQAAESSFLNIQEVSTEENFEKPTLLYNPASVMYGTNNQSNRSIGEATKSLTISEIKDDTKSDENVFNNNEHLVLAPDNQSLSIESVAQIIQQNQLLTSLLSQVASDSLEFQEDILRDNLLPSNDKNTNCLDLIKYLDPAETETYTHTKPNNEEIADSRCELSKQLLHNKDNKFMREIEEAVLNISSESFAPYSLNCDDVDTFKLKSQIADDNSDQIEMTLSSIMNYILEEPEKSSDSLFSTVGEDDTSEDLNPYMATNSAQKPKRTKKRVKKIYKEVKVKTKKSRCQKNTKANLDKDREEMVGEYFAESFKTNDCASENETRVPNRFSCDVEVQVAGGDLTDSKDKFAKKQNAETQWEDMGEGSEEESEWLWKKIKSVLKYARRSSRHSNKDRNKAESDNEEPFLRNEMHRTCHEAYSTRLNKDSDTIEKDIDHSVVNLERMVVDHKMLDNSTIEHIKITDSSPPLIMTLLDENKCKIPHSPRINKDSDITERGVDHSVVELERMVVDPKMLDNFTMENFKTTENPSPPVTTLLDEKKCKLLHLTTLNKDSDIMERAIGHSVVKLERVFTDHSIMESSTPENFKTAETSFPSIKTSLDEEKCNPLSLARSPTIELVEVKSEGSSDTHLSLPLTPVKRTNKSGKRSRQKSKFSAKNARKSNKTQSTTKCSVPNRNASPETSGKLEQKHTLAYSSSVFHLSDSEISNFNLEDDSLNNCRVLRKRKIPVSSEPPPMKRRCISGSDYQFENEFPTLSENGEVGDICVSVEVEESAVSRKTSPNGNSNFSHNQKIIRSPKRCRKT